MCTHIRVLRVEEGCEEGYTDGFRIAGGKLGLDWSIQAKTGWLKKPYFHVP
jgi:hypothetical protein